MITAHVERFTDTLEEIRPFFVPHHAELGLFQDKMPLDPKYPVYLDSEARGKLLFVTLRECGRVIAYFIGFVDTGMHYQQTLTLQMDIFWLHPDYRDGDSLEEVEQHMLCMTLFTEVRHEMRRRGIKVWYAGSKWHKNAHRVFEELGMQPADVYYAQWIGD